MGSTGELGLDHLAEAISHATAPAFMLGAVAAFLSILITRLERVIDRHRELRIAGELPADGRTHAISELMKRRMRLLSRAIMLSVVSAFVTATLLVSSFLAGLLNVGHGSVVAVLFVIALVLMMVALSDLAREVRLHISTMHIE